jgi:uncharacterized membrane protein
MLSSGVVMRLILGGFWLLVFGGAIQELSSPETALVWTVPAGVTWFFLVRNAALHPQRKAYGFAWWTLSLTGPLSLVLLLLRRDRAPRPQTTIERPTEVDMSTDDLLLRLGAAEHRIDLLQQEVASIRVALRTRTAAAAAPTAQAKPSPAPPRPTPAAASAPPPPPPVPPAPAREIDWSALLGPKALAWAGGIVTLLGVVFFFVLAVDRGWIGHEARVACGGIASAIVFAGGLWLRRRFGETYSSLAAVGAGIAGAYATLAAATVLYDLVSKPLALVTAAAIASAGVAVALAWRAELVAALGLIGAIAAPALLATEDGLSATGVGFAALVTAAAALVGVRLRWQWLLVSAAVASAPQIAALVIEADRLDAGAISLAAGFGLIYLVTGIADQLARRDDALAPLPTMFILGSIAVTWLAAAQLFGPAGGNGAGCALLVAAAAFGSTAVALWLRAQRELATLIGAIALAATAVGVANLLSDANLAYTFAAEAAVLAFTARRVRETRLQLGALAYLLLAGAHALVFDAPPDSLFLATRHPASGAAALAATVVAALAVVRLSGADWNDGSERGVLRFVAPIVSGLRTHQRELRLACACIATLFAVDAVSLAILELFESTWSSGGVTAAFHRGHVGVTIVWSLAGLAAVAVATRRRSDAARNVAFGWLAVTGLEVAAYDGTQLVGIAFSLSFAAVATALVLAGYLREVLERRTSLSWETIVAVLVGVAYGVGSLYPADTERQFGLGLLVISALLLLLAASVFTRSRDLSTLLWAPALVLAALATPALVNGTWITFAWAVATAALVGLATIAGERRLLAAAFGYAALVAAAALDHAPPSQLVVAHEHPAHAIADLLLLATALAAFAWAIGAVRQDWRAASLWASGVVVVYATSLGILELFVRVSTAGLHTDFQRGHSAVSALWGALGLALLHVGLTRGRRALRLGGFALFGVSLCKLFLYDLSELSSVTRALSFLAVGAVLLLAGFFTQRLTAQLDDHGGPGAYS